MKTLNIGLVGYGFMGRTHSNAFLQAPRYFDLPFKPVLKALCARNADRAKAFAANWGYESIESDWRKLVERKDIDLIDIASTNDTHHDIAIAAAKAGKMVMCEKPLGRNADEAKAMVAAVEAAGVAEHGLVQLPPRAGGRAAQASPRRGEVRADLPLPREVPAGLDDLRGPAAGRRGAVAARREGRGQRRHRRSPRPLHRYGALAERLDHRGLGDDRDVHQGAQAQPDRQGRARRDRRRERVPVPVQERVARDVRVDALRPRAQGALHARDQRRARLGVLGPARPAPHSSTSITRTRAACAAGAASTSPTAITRT